MSVDSCVCLFIDAGGESLRRRMAGLQAPSRGNGAARRPHAAAGVTLFEFEFEPFENELFA